MVSTGPSSVSDVQRRPDRAVVNRPDGASGRLQPARWSIEPVSTRRHPATTVTGDTAGAGRTPGQRPAASQAASPSPAANPSPHATAIGWTRRTHVT